MEKVNESGKNLVAYEGKFYFENAIYINKLMY